MTTEAGCRFPMHSGSHGPNCFTWPLSERIRPFVLDENVRQPAPRLTDAEYMTERRFRLGKDALSERPS